MHHLPTVHLEHQQKLVLLVLLLHLPGTLSMLRQHLLLTSRQTRLCLPAVCQRTRTTCLASPPAQTRKPAAAAVARSTRPWAAAAASSTCRRTASSSSSSLAESWGHHRPHHPKDAVLARLLDTTAALMVVALAGPAGASAAPVNPCTLPLVLVVAAASRSDWQQAMPAAAASQTLTWACARLLVCLRVAGSGQVAGVGQVAVVTWAADTWAGSRAAQEA